MGLSLEDNLEEIDPPECLELLRTEQVGRIGVIDEGKPEIFPVNYALDASDAVIFLAAYGTTLLAAVNHHVVFEVDRFDPDLRSGWSVIVHGVAQQTDRVLEGEQPLVTWREHAPFLVRITQRSISGRRIKMYPGMD